MRWLAAAALLAVGCGTEAPAGDPPLRPLLYTESASTDLASIEGFEEWMDPTVDPVAWPVPADVSARSRGAAQDLVLRPATTPEELMVGVFHCLLQQQREALAPLLFDAESWSRAGRIGADAARREVNTLGAGLDDLFAAFAPAQASLARPEGLRRLLAAGPVVVGRGRTIQGALVRGDEVPVMHWGSELRVELAGTNASFVLRFPRILKDETGHWRLAGVPTVDGRFQAFRALGLDLKRELLLPGHASYPLSVGNFWHYRTRRPAPSLEGESEGPQPGAITPNGYRDEVTDVIDLDMYRVVRFRRLWDNPSRASETFAWLQTATRIYRCSWDCLRNARDVAWVLAWAPQQSALFSFPAELGMSWGVGGVGVRNPVWRISSEPVNVSVPAGQFPASREFVRTAAGGRDTLYFVPGIGTVMRRQLRGFETEIEELLSYRIMP